MLADLLAVVGALKGFVVSVKQAVVALEVLLTMEHGKETLYRMVSINTDDRIYNLALVRKVAVRENF